MGTMAAFDASTGRLLGLIFGTGRGCASSLPTREVVVTEWLFLLSSWAAAVVPPRVRERVPAVRAEQSTVRTVVEIAAAVERRRMEPPVVSSRIP